MAMIGWPALPGTYALVFAAAEPGEIEIGHLGVQYLPAGWYAYAGSALGPGGLAGRLNRHLQLKNKRVRWHVDYLAECWPITRVLARMGAGRQECAWVRRLLALPGAAAPVRGFGSSDCREACPAHLIRLPGEFDLAILGTILGADRESCTGPASL